MVLFGAVGALCSSKKGGGDGYLKLLCLIWVCQPRLFFFFKFQISKKKTDDDRFIINKAEEVMCVAHTFKTFGLFSFVALSLSCGPFFSSFY